MNEINEKYSEILACKEYLNSTDYMIIKRSETGFVVPEEVLVKREEMRGRINALELEIKAIEEEMKELKQVQDEISEG